LKNIVVNMNAIKWISWPKRFLLLAVVLAGLWGLRHVWLGQKVAAYAVQQADLQQTLVASGRVLWPQRIALAAEITGRVKHIPVSEGQQVKRGQLLIQLDDAEALAAVMQAQAVVAQAQAKLQQLHEVGLPSAQENWRQAQADVEQLSQQYKRMKKLQQQDFASQAELETATRNLAVAKSRLQAAQLSVRSYQSRGSDRVIAEANLAQSRISLQQAQVQLAQFQLLAPAEGTLISTTTLSKNVELRNCN
jgi:HlyD family secretion protein